ncbi:extracellular solute-binding protein [Salinarimonas soli]|uniref:ABC transporter substrate-binding protein n=1 Tax=Salinarimonas soli TaxID=1638099 RepID=A0A5B2VDW9_9HYPH|nr:extracellular solute-binding protein [Salinarimonas soli]KAA2236975.1 ABC transporter substrate-binding protein [Salinarimonas soli]
MRRFAQPILRAIALVLALLPGPPAAAGQPTHGLAMHGEPALPPGFSHFPYADPEAPKGGRLVLGLPGTFDGLNPHVVKGVAPDAVSRFVLQSLMVRSLDEPFTLYGLVANAVEIDAGRSRATFRLDPRARFSDGVALTARDVAFSFELLRSRGKPFHRASFAGVASVEVIDDQTIRFDMPDSGDRELPLLIGLMPIFPAHATDSESFEENTLKPMVGSGPYAVSEVRPGERVTLTRRPDYWGADLPTGRGLNNFDEIRYDFYRDANTLLEAFKAGLYDLRVENDPARWSTGYDFALAREGRIRREAVPVRTPKGMNAFVLNTRRPLLSDARVREALSLLFDFDWVNRNLYFAAMRRTASYFEGSDLASTGQPASAEERRLLEGVAIRDDVMEGRWLPPGSDGSGGDRAAAREALRLLGEAGFGLQNGTLRRRDTGEPLSFEILVTNRAQERLALNYAGSLARIGVTARVRVVDDVQYWRRLTSFDFDVVQWTWAASLSPGNEQRNRWSPAAAERSGSLNYAGVREPAVDRVIDAMLAAETRAAFVDAVRALDRLLLAGFYVVPLFNLPDQWLAFDAGLRKPVHRPLLGVPVELWWRESP